MDVYVVLRLTTSLLSMVGALIYILTPYTAHACTSTDSMPSFRHVWLVNVAVANSYSKCRSHVTTPLVHTASNLRRQR